jgi:hypothetical protein
MPRKALRRETETQPSNVASSTLPRKRTLEFESDGEVDEPEDFKINTEYAKRFHHNKEREEIHRRKYLFVGDGVRREI